MWTCTSYKCRPVAALLSPCMSHQLPALQILMLPRSFMHGCLWLPFADFCGIYCAPLQPLQVPFDLFNYLLRQRIIFLAGYVNDKV